MNGNFNILIDPSDTDVSIKYEIKLDTQYIDNANIEIYEWSSKENKANILDLKAFRNE